MQLACSGNSVPHVWRVGCQELLIYFPTSRYAAITVLSEAYRPSSVDENMPKHEQHNTEETKPESSQHVSIGPNGIDRLSEQFFSVSSPTCSICDRPSWPWPVRRGSRRQTPNSTLRPYSGFRFLSWRSRSSGSCYAPLSVAPCAAATRLPACAHQVLCLYKGQVFLRRLHCFSLS